MAIHINLDSEYCKTLENKDIKVHHMPCNINADSQANVETFFEECIENNQETNELNNSFRGYPLQGKVYDAPDGYVGLVLQESNKTLAEETQRNFHLKQSFQKFTSWNWDRLPSKNDAIVQAFDWIDIAKALHTPVETATSQTMNGNHDS